MNTTRCTSSYVCILKFARYMFRKDPPFNISSLHITVYAANHSYHDMYKQLHIQGYANC
jgi:hypothetical protein